MTRHPVPAFRSFDVAAAYYLAHDSDLPARFRYDAPVNLWRDRSGKPTTFGAVTLVATETLHTALSEPDIPTAFRCVFAPVERVEALAAVTDWHAERDRLDTEESTAHRARWEADEADKRRRRAALLAEVEAGRNPAAHFALPATEPTPYRRLPPRRRALVDSRQRERLLRSVTGRQVREAVMTASHHEPFRYRAVDAPVQVDPRAWLASLPREDGAETLRSAVYRAYLDALPDGARPLDERRFHALARETFGDPTRRHPGHWYYRDVRLPEPSTVADDDTAERPALRVVS